MVAGNSELYLEMHGKKPNNNTMLNKNILKEGGQNKDIFRPKGNNNNNKNEPGPGVAIFQSK